AAGPVTDVGVWNLGLGAVSGTASWNGEPLSSWPATVRLRPPGFNWTWEAFLDGGAFSVANLVPGTYDAWVSLDCAGSVAIQTLTIAAGANSPAIFDISAEAGRAVGQITSAGAPVASGYVVLSGCGSALGTDPAGNFATSLLAVGSYTAVVYTLTETGYRFLGSLPFAITAGTTTDLGTVDLSPSFP